jgi:hypothetical protein
MYGIKIENLSLQDLLRPDILANPYPVFRRLHLEATLAPGGRISVEIAQEEIERLGASWARPQTEEPDEILSRLLSEKALGGIDLFDRAQLAEVAQVCRNSRSMSEAGRRLFGASRIRKTSSNDARIACESTSTALESSGTKLFSLGHGFSLDFSPTPRCFCTGSSTLPSRDRICDCTAVAKSVPPKTVSKEGSTPRLPRIADG